VEQNNVFGYYHAAMKIRTLLTAAALAASTAACAQPTTGLDDAQRVVLEIEYINYAWTPQYFGFFVDASGRVFSYNRNGTPYPHQTSADWTVRDLDDKFVPIRNQETTRPAAEIQALDATIEAAASGSLSTPKTQCADAGTLTYRAYRWDGEAARYRAVPLRVEGDFAQQNTSQAAQTLIAYIRSLDLMEEMLGCDP
jgi:hypothetical protein